jgi:hypothetical protein
VPSESWSDSPSTSWGRPEFEPGFLQVWWVGSQVGSLAFPGSFVQRDLPPQLARREASSPRSTWFGGAWQEQPSRQAGDIEPVTRRWKYHPPNPRWCPQRCCRRGQRETEKAPKLLGSKFIKQAGSNSADSVQRLSPKNKVGFLYKPFRAGYRNGGRLQLVP